MSPATRTGPVEGPRATVAVKLLIALAVVALLLVGIWFSGAAITNDFEISMLLTGVWLGIAGLACLLIARRRRDLRLPVIGAYLVTAVVVGIYLTSSTFLDDEVNEEVVSAQAPAPDPDASAAGAERKGNAAAGARTDARNLLLAKGGFESLAHPASGVASAIQLAKGGRVLTLTGFKVDNGPDLRVYLVAGAARKESDVDDFEDLGALKGNKGDQQYAIPGDVKLERYSTVVIWCRAFSVAFARAPLRQG